MLNWRRQSARNSRVILIFTLLATLSACVAVPAPAGNVAPGVGDAATVVQIDSGMVEGIVENDVIAFKGIPYAAPPVGDLRWQATQPVAPWTEVRAAKEFGADCMQVADGTEPIQTTPSEDCLFVNVWKPADAPAAANLPVMVWIHGGGFVGGGSSIPYYDGSAFARHGMVVVSLNYRLGRLGFFAHPALLAAKEGPVGNFGFMDQIAALKWVQTNVAAFGGDPAQVTLVGESAGGASVLSLLTSPMTDGLFHQVVVMSGGGRRALVSRPMTNGTPAQPSADQTDAQFAAALGVEGESSEALAALRALPAAELVGELTLPNLLKEAFRCPLLELAAPEMAQGCVPIYHGTQMVDGEIVLGEPGAMIARGQMAQVPIIIGTTAADLPLYFPPSIRDPYAYFGEDAAAAQAHYSLPPDTASGLVASGHPELVVALPLLAIGADITMHEGARFAAREMSAAGNPAWLYRFTYVAEALRPSTGQTHAGELPFLFQTLDARYPEGLTDQDRQTAQAFNAYIANFILSGDPNGGDLPTWPQFDAARYELLDFTFDDGPIFGPDPRAVGIELVQRVGDAQGVTNMSTGEAQTALSGVLTGTVTYRQRVALPAGSVVEVQLQDVSRADAPAQVIASQTITTAGENVPLPFTLTYDPAQIDARFTYALSVRITSNGQLRWVNTERYAVLTQGASLNGVEVVVQPVQ